MAKIKDFIKKLRKYTIDGKMITNTELDEIEENLTPEELCEHVWQITKQIRAGKTYTIIYWCSKCGKVESKPTRIYLTGEYNVSRT